MSVTILENKSEDIKNLFSFVMESHLNENSKLAEIKQKVKEFCVKNFDKLENDQKTKLKEEFENFSFFDFNNFSDDTQKTEELFKLMVTLSKVKEEMIVYLSEHKRKINFGKVERKVSPSLEAYDYTGNNKLNISNSKKSYGLLFE